MRLPRQFPNYSLPNEEQRNHQIEQADKQNHKKNQDVEIGVGRLILTSPDGTRWDITVDNAGVISAASI